MLYDVVGEVRFVSTRPKGAPFELVMTRWGITCYDDLGTAGANRLLAYIIWEVTRGVSEIAHAS